MSQLLRRRGDTDTRQRLLAAAHQIFCAQPYSQVSGLQISRAAGVTRGGLQYHFGSKQGLFLAVLQELQHGVVDRVTAALAEHVDRLDRARAGVAAFLDACAEPDYQAVVLKQGPAAIGWQRWRELDNDCFGHLVVVLVDMLAPAGLVDDTSVMIAAAVRGTLTELSFEIAQSADRAGAHARALSVAEHMLTALAGRQPAGVYV